MMKRKFNTIVDGSMSEDELVRRTKLPSNERASSEPLQETIKRSPWCNSNHPAIKPTIDIIQSIESPSPQEAPHDILPQEQIQPGTRETTLAPRRGRGRPRKSKNVLLPQPRSAAVSTRNRKYSPRERALLLRRTQLQKAYHQVSTALKPALEELAVRNSEALEKEDDPLAYQRTLEYRQVKNDLDQKLDDAQSLIMKKRQFRANELGNRLDYEKYVIDQAFNRKIELLEETYVSLALLDNLQTITDAEAAEDTDQTDDEDSLAKQQKGGSQGTLLLGASLEELEYRILNQASGERWLQHIEEACEDFKVHQSAPKIINSKKGCQSSFKSIDQDKKVAEEAKLVMNTLALAAQTVEMEKSLCSPLRMLADEAAKKTRAAFKRAPMEIKQFLVDQPKEIEHSKELNQATRYRRDKEGGTMTLQFDQKEIKKPILMPAIQLSPQPHLQPQPPPPPPPPPLSIRSFSRSLKPAPMRNGDFYPKILPPASSQSHTPVMIPVIPRPPPFSNPLPRSLYQDQYRQPPIVHQGSSQNIPQNISTGLPQLLPRPSRQQPFQPAPYTHYFQSPPPPPQPIMLPNGTRQQYRQLAPHPHVAPSPIAGSQGYQAYQGYPYGSGSRQ